MNFGKNLENYITDFLNYLHDLHNISRDTHNLYLKEIGSGFDLNIETKLLLVPRK